ncbi:SDR family NAD(P)-dependent oxidoreductase [Pelagicoccus sp. SDUM812002]|uniref:SDR family NAD(P)-dependent oxidoreductase n=1 Tax=Pelagicoccus sp. SDUM812002 TaxID=3041266 RepID=UPI00280D0E03|nr:SDR family NAD(P)-dependent oxidoreductase [Pelagicoccus sp. SDUM812002]MDQ8185628.1 SDR family NAD(P)-dependent oxidoreductase [Pelagicoccus sp. SDUM812002]
MGSKYNLVIVTGGSSGIGKSIIEDISKLDPEASLFNLSRRIPASFYNDPKRVHLECDLADRACRIRVLDDLERRISDSTQQGPILLVNNAGFGIYGDLGRNSPAEHLELLEVNVCALVELTTRLLPLIKKRGGAIMNIASTSAFQPTPYLATYGASKAFVLSWTLALNEELRGTAAHAIAVCPGPTKTEFFKRAGFAKRVVPAGYSHSPEQVSSMALKALERRRTFTTTGTLNKVLSLLVFILPLSLRTRAAGKFIRRFRSDPSN